MAAASGDAGEVELLPGAVLHLGAAQLVWAPHREPAARPPLVVGRTVCVDLPPGASLADLVASAAAAAGCAPEAVASLRTGGGAPGCLPVVLLPLPPRGLLGPADHPRGPGGGDDGGNRLAAWLGQDLRALGVRCSDAAVAAATSGGAQLPALALPLPAPAPSLARGKCGNCGAPEAKKLCAGCQRVRYCSAACQRNHRRDHRSACQTAAAAPNAHCPAGHAMAKTTGAEPGAYEAWRCDGCSLRGSGPRWWCRSCKHDVCLPCAAAATATAEASGGAGSGSSSSSSARWISGEDGRLYCGQRCSSYFDGPQRRCRTKGVLAVDGACKCDGVCGGGGGGPCNGVRAAALPKQTAWLAATLRTPLSCGCMPALHSIASCALATR
jgi:hypothetical protein